MLQQAGTREAGKACLDFGPTWSWQVYHCSIVEQKAWLCLLRGRLFLRAKKSLHPSQRTEPQSCHIGAEQVGGRRAAAGEGGDGSESGRPVQEDVCR